MATVLSVYSQGQTVRTLHVEVDRSERTDSGLYVQKIGLSAPGNPIVKVSNVRTRPVLALPPGLRASNAFEPDVLVGTERKQNTAFIQLPAFVQRAGKFEELLSYDLELTEWASPQGGALQRPTASGHSVLAQGTWYKFATTERGIYKIDYNFLQSLGLNPGQIDPGMIRIYGNGGAILNERVDPNQPDDLIENAIVVNASGNTFGPNDYILFYAGGHVKWEGDAFRKRFIHTNNYYEDQSYYFISVDQGPGKRVQEEAASGHSGAVSFATFDEYAVRDIDSFNLGNVGKVWWSNRMSPIGNTLSQTISMDLGAVADSVFVETYVGSVNVNNGNMINLFVNDRLAHTFNLNGIFSSVIVTTEQKALTLALPSGVSNFRYQYQPNGNGMGYIDFIRLNYKRHLDFNNVGGQLAFRNWESSVLGAQAYAAFPIANANAQIRVWEITDPLKPVALQGVFEGGKYTVEREGNKLREFIAFDGSRYLSPKKLGQSVVANQDLHGMGPVDLLIITREDLLPAAEELADFHRNQEQLKVGVATVDKIYNEFSSGGQDISGIRNFIKMFYDRASGPADMIKNVLFMGAASFDYKDRIQANTNIVPTFQTYSSVYTEGSSGAYASDDFFGLLDNGNDELLDVGIGRIPAYSLDEAGKVVNKIKNYYSPNSFGPWKNIVTYVADDKDAGINGMNHLEDCERANSFFRTSDKPYNLYKIYADAHPLVTAAANNRYPSVNKAINDRIANGTLLMSYSGHGSPERWAHEAILTPEDYGSWRNINNLPLMVTATCDFGRFDDPTRRSSGAKLLINPLGGSIAMITTTQLVYATPNTALMQRYIAKQFLPDAKGQHLTLGEALSQAKNDYLDGGANNRKFAILGDPALKLQIPYHKVKTLKLYQEVDGQALETDTIRALGRYRLEGVVTDWDEQVMDDFNGEVFVTIYDKEKQIRTINQRPGVERVTASFPLQTNVVASVNGTVSDGRFALSFVAPKDINYEYGAGKVSYYAHNDKIDAAGFDTSMLVGGYNTFADDDNEGPVVLPYIDNEMFRDGGVTGPNPTLFVKLYDDNGINVSGSSVGHDLIAVLDDDWASPFVMNDFYRTLSNDYRNGYVRFKFYNLPDGKHTLRVRAWDVYNNSGEGTVTFEVRNKDKGFISDIYNYPNPVTEGTRFVFQHNQEMETLTATLQIYTATGQLVRTLREKFEAAGNRSEMYWDGKGEGGHGLQKGVYFYKLDVMTDKGKRAMAYQKLVLLR